MSKSIDMEIKKIDHLRKEKDNKEVEKLRKLGFVVQDDGFIGMEADEVYEIIQSIKLGKRNNNDFTDNKRNRRKKDKKAGNKG